MEGFDWDEANVEHIARHGVTPEEAEEVFADPDRVVTPGKRATERRYVVTGRTESGRILSVVFTARREHIRVVTARRSNPYEQRRYQGKR